MFLDEFCVLKKKKIPHKTKSNMNKENSTKMSKYELSKIE